MHCGEAWWLGLGTGDPEEPGGRSAQTAHDQHGVARASHVCTYMFSRDDIPRDEPVGRSLYLFGPQKWGSGAGHLLMALESQVMVTKRGAAVGFSTQR